MRQLNKLTRSFPTSLLIFSILFFIVMFSINTQCSGDTYKQSKAIIDALITQAKSDTHLKEATKNLQKAINYIKNTKVVPPLEQAFLLGTTWQTLGQLTQKQWKTAPDDLVLKHQAYKYQRKAIDIFIQLNQTAKRQADRLDHINSAKAESTGQYVSQSQYAIGWAYHDLAQAAPTRQERDSHLKSAIIAFKYFTDNDYHKHPIIADTFLAHGICLNALTKYKESLSLLRPINKENTPQTIYPKIVMLKCNNYTSLKQYFVGINTLKAYFKAQQQNNSKQLNSSSLNPLLLIEWAKLIVLQEEVSSTDFSKDIATIADLINQEDQSYQNHFFDLIGPRDIDSPGFIMSRIKVLFNAKSYNKALLEISKGIKVTTSKDPQYKDLLYAQILCKWHLKDYFNAYQESKDYLNHQFNDKRNNEIAIICIESGYQSLLKEEQPTLDQLNQTYTMVQEKHASTEVENHLLLKQGWLALKAKKYYQARNYFQQLKSHHELFGQALYGILQCLNEINPSLIELKQTHALLTQWQKLNTKQNDIEKNQVIRFANLIIKHTKTHDINEGLIDLINTISNNPLLPPSYNPIFNETMLTQHLANKSYALFNLSLQAYCQNKLHTEHKAIFLYNLIGQLDTLTSKDEHPELQASSRMIFELILPYITKHADSAVASKQNIIHIKYIQLLFNLNEYKTCIDQINIIQKQPVTTSIDTLMIQAKCHEHLESWQQATAIWQSLIKRTPKHQEKWYQSHYHYILSLRNSNQIKEANQRLNNFKVRYMPISNSVWQDKFNTLTMQVSREHVAL